MTSFEDREKDFENKFVYDKKIDFKVEARASKLLGLWAAGKLGLSGEDAQKYAMEVVGANLEEAGFDDVIRKVSKDLAAKSIEISKHLLEVEMEKAVAEARQQVAEGR